ncbi:winged helix-turn-helix domain-containing protein [Bacillus inaquosorum]|uniref:winged helix-turn-helix domain-containing protein n=1 Tax=Bacillus inaquosorum TaxID=483913 RepID=UPI002280EBBF|nr:winged helix-turn-helix domain-containing protein [Bacillus inaquosorum]MCY7759241.1 winged helix-turn-helix domain-containing protein [Bacillus inaquosorum]MCY8725144.1 winged helix-turn-helix domain-containing protein [Bacillus inaquosorum]MCY8733798.1 winged helix-turn-helix domain-containing protein [Bacillus inaquosorum]MCY8789800.1 winged helix-turn-helix domain-containing protein [Bacillus inaquosorum]MCY9031939.1 winged helix-turn-helix domain-containing protein [Bacillus inaquosoru
MKKILVFSKNSYFLAYTRHVFKPNGVEIICVKSSCELKRRAGSEEFFAVILDKCLSNDLNLSLIKNISSPLIILDSLESQDVLDFTLTPFIDLLDNMKKKKRNIIELAPSTFFDIGKHCIWKKEEYIPLPAQEFKILYLLYLNLNNIVTSEELISYADLTSRSSLYVYINSLREKIEDNLGNPEIIQTKFGKGYLIKKKQSSSYPENVVKMTGSEHMGNI